MNEVNLIRLFMDLTGATESTARSVVMYLDILERHYSPGRENIPVRIEDRTPTEVNGGVPNSLPLSSSGNPG
jgi:hypothetical protein